MVACPPPFMIFPIHKLKNITASSSFVQTGKCQSIWMKLTLQMPFEAFNVYSSLWWAACQEYLSLFFYIFFSWGTPKSDKKSFQVSVAVGTVATFIRRHHCWLLHNNVAANEWMTEWASEWVSKWVSGVAMELNWWKWMQGDDDNVFNSLQTVHFPNTELHFQLPTSASPPASTTIPQAWLCTLSVLGFLFSVVHPWYHPGFHSGSHVLHYQQRHFKPANQSNSCRRVSIFNFKARSLCV